MEPGRNANLVQAEGTVKGVRKENAFWETSSIRKDLSSGTRDQLMDKLTSYRLAGKLGGAWEKACGLPGPRVEYTL